MKNARQQKILELIDRYEISTQEELMNYLRDEGFSVTQTTVSRDMNDLRIVKGFSHGTYRYVSSRSKDEGGTPVLSSILTESVVSLTPAKNLLVIKTFSGMANALAVCIDSMKHSAVVGTIAGDDTILIITPDDDACQMLSNSLKTAFGVTKR